jgi:hypothetical protein
MSRKRIYRLDWRLPELMTERRIHSGAQLHRKLSEIGVKISASQLSRIHWDMPERLNRNLLEGLLTVLECTMDDLMPLVPESSPETRLATKAKRMGKAPQPTRTFDSCDIERLAGPMAVSFKIPERQ